MLTEGGGGSVVYHLYILIIYRGEHVNRGGGGEVL